MAASRFIEQETGTYTEFRIRLPVADNRPADTGANAAAPAPALPAGPADFQLTF